jgi:hypothetical protein
MAKISVIHKQTGDVLFSASDHPGAENPLTIHGGGKWLDPLLKHAKTVDDLIDFLIPFSDRVLVKAEEVEVNQEGEATEDAPNMPAPGTMQEPVASEEISSRIEPALKIIKDILTRAEQKKAKRADIQSHVEALKLEQQHAQAIIPMDGQFYVTMDGDGIGNQVARAQYTDDEAKVKEVSLRIESGKELFVQWGIVYGGVVIEVGGDEGQVRVPSTALDHIEEFRANYKKQVGATVTVGVGRTISESIQARELGKLRGKNQVVYFDENTEKELELRLQTKGDQSPEKKLAESGVLDKKPDETPQVKMGQQPSAPKRPMPKYGVPDGHFAENQKKQQEYEDWLRSQKKEIS